MHHISRRLSFSPSSLSKNNRAFAETSYLVGGSNVWSRRNSAAASPATATAATADVSSKASGRSKKRITKAERKSLVVSFVNHYREMNLGKFPSAKEAQKEVGGSYYTARQVIQELEYETRMLSTSLHRQSPKTEVSEKMLSTSLHRQSPKTEVSEKKDQLKDMDVKEKVTTSRTDLFDGETKVVHQTPEILVDTMKEKTITKGDHQLESPETVEPVRDMPKEHNGDVESPKKSFSWSLKSLADDLINFWRKL